MTDLGLALYEKLFLVRTAEAYIVKHYPSDEMKNPMHMSMGQEAIAVGVCHALEGQGDVICSYRSHATFLALTDNLGKFFGEMYGRVTGTASGKAGSMHLAAPEAGHLYSSAVVGEGIPVAVGAAFANKRAGNGRIGVAFLGDGALDQGVFWESLNLACVMRLPVLFVCEDNGLAAHTDHATRRGYDSAPAIIERFNCHVWQDDSNDVEKIYRITREAVAKLADGQPAFLEFKCYRYLEHVGVGEDFDVGYRSREEYEAWREKDCVECQRARLVERGHQEAEIAAVERRIVERVESSIEEARAAPHPKPEDLYKGVFCETD